MSIFHFMRTLETIRGSLRLIPGLKDKIDFKLLRKVDKSFQRAFPVALKMRRAIAHLGEIGNTVEKRKSNFADIPDHYTITSAPGARAKINQSFDGASFMMTFEGETISYDLIYANYALLRTLAQDCLRAFESSGEIIAL